jgi:glycosyltransferase involved in cell wall biosynthesis
MTRECIEVRVLNVIFDDRFGGMANRVIQVAQALQAQDVDTLLCLPRGEGNTSEIAEQKGIPVRRVDFSPIPRFGKLGRLVRWLTMFPADIWRFSRLYRTERADLVHVSGAFFLTPAIASKLSRIPLVWHLNDTIVPKMVAPFFGKLVNWMADWIMLEAKVAGEHYAVNQDKCSLVHPPVDTQLFHPVQKEDRESRESVARMGIIANWTPVKGIEYFVRAAAQIRDRLDRNLEVLFAGIKLSTHAAYSEGIEDLIRSEGLENCVHYYGFVTEIAPVLSRLDVLVLSSLTEACPLAIVEAMASGIPVVATDVGGVHELLSADPENPAGILVPPKNVEAIAEAVVDLLAHPDKAQAMGRNGRRIAEAFFSVDLCAKRHREVYEALSPPKS